MLFFFLKGEAVATHCAVTFCYILSPTPPFGSFDIVYRESIELIFEKQICLA